MHSRIYFQLVRNVCICIHHAHNNDNIICIHICVDKNSENGYRGLRLSVRYFINHQLLARVTPRRDAETQPAQPAS